MFHIRLKSQNKSETLHEIEPGITRQIVWDNEEVNNFKSLLINNSNHIQRLTSDIASESVDDVAGQFTVFLHDKAFEMFGKKKLTVKKTCRKVKNKTKQKKNGSAMIAKLRSAN